MCVVVDRGRHAPSQSNDVSLTRSTRETQTSFVQSMTAGQTSQQMKLNSWEWDHSCNTEDAVANGKYLEEVDTFDIDGLQGRHIAEYSEQRRPNVGMLPNYFLWGGV